MIADTSAWIEFLRATGSPVHRRLRAEIDGGADLVVPELVVMELVVGSGDEALARRLRALLNSFEIAPLAPLVDSEHAAALQRRCLAGGRRVRSMVDCLIAATAIRLDEPVLHLDSDFDVLADLTELTVVAH